jgi:1-acyl-sn-glycerol-3-phosphate acyltransferase
MSDDTRIQAPTAETIIRRFHSPKTLILRPIIHGVIRIGSVFRGYSWKSRGAEHLPIDDAPLILASNHCSHADTAAIHGTLPRKLAKKTCVAAALDVFGPATNGPVRTYRAWKRECLQLIVAAWFRAFAFDRHGSSLRSMRTATTLIDHGWNLLLYPEGTRSRTGKMARFKSGVSLIVRATNRPVIPVHVHGGRKVLPPGSSFPRPGQIIVRYGRPMFRRDDESSKAFARRIEQAVRDLGQLTEQELATQRSERRLARLHRAGRAAARNESI